MSTADAFLRGAPWPGAPGVPYPRADPADVRRLPADTWAAASVPAGVRLEVTGTARAVDIDYTLGSDDPGHRGPGAGVTFSAWVGDEQVDEQPAAPGGRTVRIGVRPGGRTVVHLPEGLRPEVTAVRPVGGGIRPPPPQPRWLAYGDSITEGWSATSPAAGWVARAGRIFGLDAVNLGYAGAARGELASAQQVASLPADVVSIAFGTNCWSMVPHSAALLEATVGAFIQLLRTARPDVPVVVVSPVIRPDAEAAPNRMGATLADLRRAVEAAAAAHPGVTVVPGLDLVPAAMLVDGVHPGDAGHRRLAEAIGPVLRAAVDGWGGGPLWDT